MWRTVTVSSNQSASFAAVTVTVRAVFQLLAPYVSASGATVTSASSLATLTVTDPLLGATFNATV